jgi:hypothetical protein
MEEENAIECVVLTFQLTLSKDELPKWDLIADGICSRVPGLKRVRADARLSDGSVMTVK